MQTHPCGHRVVCRLCFVKTIQTAVSQRVLPLRCVVCRTKILKLKQTSPAPAPPPSVTAAWSRGLSQVRATRHAGVPGVGSCTAAGITAALSPRHSAGGASKLMQPLPIYPAALSGAAGGGVTSSGGGRSAMSTGSTGSCHHHHFPLHHPGVMQRRAMTAWTTSAAPPPTSTTTTTSLTVSGASLATRPPAAGAVFNVVTGCSAARSTTSRRSTSSSAASYATDSPRITAAIGRLPAAGHDTKRIQRLKWYHIEPLADIALASTFANVIINPTPISNADPKSTQIHFDYRLYLPWNQTSPSARSFLKQFSHRF